MAPFVKDLDARHLKIGPGEWIDVRDCAGGIQWWAGMGGLVTTTKPDEVSLWQGYTQKRGRARSLILFDGVNGGNLGEK